jgi:protein O-mannosyl-transferase
MNTLRNKSIVAASVAIITFIVYLPSLQNGFVNWDDGDYVYENAFIQQIDDQLFKSAFTEFNASNWHPLTWISHALDYALWGLNPRGHHLTNNILHAINTLLVVLFVSGILHIVFVKTRTDGTSALLAERGTLIAGAIAGLLFGLHPLHVESVAWVSERKDVLCALFFFLSLLAYMNYAKTADDGEKSASWFLSRRYLLALVFFIFALLSKPMAVTLPVVLLILDWYPFGRIWSRKSFIRALIEKFPFFAFSLLSAALTILAQKAGNAVTPIEAVPLLTRVMVGARSLISYLLLMAAPVDLLPVYMYPRHPSLLSPGYLVPVLLVLGITVSCFVTAKKQKVWSAVWLYYVITLLPVIGLIQVGRQAMADRYTYIPSVGPFLLAGLGVSLIYKKLSVLERRGLFLKFIGGGVAAVLFLLLSYGTTRQIPIWKSSIDLWNYEISKEPGKIAFAYNNRALAFIEEGQDDRALKDFDKAIAIDPADYRAYNNRGCLYFGTGLTDKSIEDFNKAISINPKYDKAYNNRGFAYIEKTQYDRAIEDYSKAIALNPRYDKAYNDRGVAYLGKNKIDLAIADFNKAIELNPKNEKQYRNRGAAHMAARRFDAARSDLSKAIELDPSDNRAYYNMACLYSLQKNADESCSLLKKAIDHGYDNWGHMKQDPDLEYVRHTECYQKVVKKK